MKNPRTNPEAAFLLCVAATFSAWAYGGAEVWAIYGLFGLALLAFACGITRLLGRFRLYDWRWGLPVVGLMLFVAIQAVNPSHRFSALDEGLTVLPHIAWLPTSVAAPFTLHSLLLLFSYAVLYWTSSRVIDDDGLNAVMGVVVAGAVAMAILALVQGSEHEQWELVGRFLNENSFSSYINLVFPVALGVARVQQQRGRRQERRSNPGMLLYFCAGILGVSVLLSGSRAGAAVTAVLLLAWVFLEWRDAGRAGGTRRAHSVWHVALPVLAVAGLLALLGVDILTQEVAALEGRVGLHVGARLSAARGTWCMFMDKPIFGVGAGTFNAAFPYYQPADLGGFYRHAHNDWVQWLAELGIVGCGLGAAALVYAFRPRPHSGRSVAISPHIARGLWLGLAGVALHAVIDFPFRIPAIAAVVALWVGALSRRSRSVAAASHSHDGILSMRPRQSVALHSTETL